MAQWWKCPDPSCSPTDFQPVDVTTMGPGGDRVYLCGGSCGKSYPLNAFKRVPPDGMPITLD